MEFEGKIIAILPMRKGVSQQSGSEWASQEYVIQENKNEDYPRKMCFEVFGADRIARFLIAKGEILKVSFDIDAREYQGRWYNTIRAWKVERPYNAPEPPAPYVTAEAQTPRNGSEQPEYGRKAAEAQPSVDDLPF